MSSPDVVACPPPAPVLHTKVACYGKIAKKQILAENGSVPGREKKRKL
jgi:hypothetical protein